MAMLAPAAMRMPALLPPLPLLLLLLLLGAHPGGVSSSKRGRDQATARGANPELDEHGLPRTEFGRAEASDAQRATLPDRADKRVARQLQCSICVATVHEAALALPPRRKGGAPPKEFEIAEALEDLCLELESYGLSMEYNKPTTRYSNDGRVGRHKGDWIERYAVNKCGDIVNDYEEELVGVLLPLLPADASHSMAYDKHAEAVEIFCQATLGICEEGDRDLLGDWEGDGVTTMQTVDPREMREPLQREVGDPLYDKHAEIPEGKTINDLLPEDMPIMTEEDLQAAGAEAEQKKGGGGKQSKKGKKSKKSKKKSYGQQKIDEAREYAKSKAK